MRPPRHLRRMRVLVVPRSIQFTWAGMLIMAVYMNVVRWFAAQDLGDPAWIQYPLITLGFTLVVLIRLSAGVVKCGTDARSANAVYPHGMGAYEAAA